MLASGTSKFKPNDTVSAKMNSGAKSKCQDEIHFDHSGQRKPAVARKLAPRCVLCTALAQTK